MLKQGLFTITLWLSVLAAQANGANVPTSSEYTVDPTHSFVQARTQHLGISWLYLRFDVTGGVLVYDPKTPKNNKIQLDVDVASLDSNNFERDAHLRKKYLLTATHPHASFSSTGYQGDAEKGILTGVLTLNGVEKTVRLPVEKVGIGADPWGGYRVGFEGKFTIDTRDYGYKYQLGDHSFKVELTLSIEGVRNTEPTRKQ